MLEPHAATATGGSRWVRVIRARLRTAAGKVEAGLLAVTVLALLVAGAAVAIPEQVGGRAAGPIWVAAPPAGVAEPPQDVPLPAAEDGGELQIVEFGFSRIQTSSGRDDLVTWGLVVENASQLTAAVARVDVAVVDVEGESILAGEPPTWRKISLVMPGTRAGIGGVYYVTGPHAADVTVTLDSVEWWPLEYECRWLVCGLIEPELGRLTVGQVDASFDSDGWPPLVLRFPVDSDYDYILDRPQAYAVFRDPDGRIVGGSSRYEIDPWATIPPGHSVQRIDVRYPPPEDRVDLAGTEVYVYSS